MITVNQLVKTDVIVQDPPKHTDWLPGKDPNPENCVGAGFAVYEIEIPGPDHA